MVRALVGLYMAGAVCAGAAQAQEGYVVNESRYSVQETIDRLAEAAGSKGLSIVARIDHSAAAAKAGLQLNDSQVLIFGNPKLGTPLMEVAPSVGIDLPLRVSAWKDDGGKVRIAYLDPQVLAQRHGIAKDDPTIGKMSGALANLAQQAAGLNP